MPTITTTAFRAALQTALDTYGEDFTYRPIEGDSCFYRTPAEDGERFHTSGDAGCIIGQALNNLGLLPETCFMSYDHNDQDDAAQFIEGLMASQAFSRLGITFVDEAGNDVTENVGYAANKVQSRQDEGGDWGNSAYEWDKRIVTAVTR